MTEKLLILHDLPPELAREVLPGESDGVTVFDAFPRVAHCVGCFGCWIKTPGRCVIPDRGSDFVGLLSQCDRLALLSRCVYGGLSPAVKAVIDRSIGFMLPFFQVKNGEMHHSLRFNKTIQLSYYYYGNDIAEGERQTARRLAIANARNFGALDAKVLFFDDAMKAGEALWR